MINKEIMAEWQYLSPIRVHTGESEICDSKYFDAL